MRASQASSFSFTTSSQFYWFYSSSAVQNSSSPIVMIEKLVVIFRLYIIYQNKNDSQICLDLYEGFHLVVTAVILSSQVNRAFYKGFLLHDVSASGVYSITVIHKKRVLTSETSCRQLLKLVYAWFAKDHSKIYMPLLSIMVN